MPIIKCPGCGEKTNSALTFNAWDADNTTCLLTVTDTGFSKGCGYESASPADKKSANELIESSQKKAYG